MEVNVQAVTDAVSLVATVTPQVLAAYSTLKSIWTQANPGKTEADFLAMLDAASQTNIDDATAILIRDGYSLSADGEWQPPAAS